MAATGEAYTPKVLGQPGIVFIYSGKASAMHARELGESCTVAAMGKWPFSRMILGLLLLLLVSRFSRVRLCATP